MINKITIETDIKTLMEILQKTGNPNVAADILNGTYQEPEFNSSDRASSPDNEGNRRRLIFESYNKWDDEINYKEKGSYTRQMSRSAWESLDLWEHVMDSQAHDYQMAP